MQISPAARGKGGALPQSTQTLTPARTQGYGADAKKNKPRSKQNRQSQLRSVRQGNTNGFLRCAETDARDFSFRKLAFCQPGMANIAATLGKDIDGSGGGSVCTYD